MAIECEGCDIWGYNWEVCGIGDCHRFEEAPEVEVKKAKHALAAFCNSLAFLLMNLILWGYPF